MLEKSKQLHATSDTEHLIADSFLYNGQLTDLYLYPTELRLLQKNKQLTIPIEFSLNFSIIYNAQTPIGLEFKNGNERIELMRDFWPRASEWQNMLLAYVTRKDFHQFFKPMRKIGKGNFATVYLAQDLRINRSVAIKAFMKEVAFKGEGKGAIQNEIKLMRRLKSQSIVTLYGIYQTKNSLYLAMEYLEGLNLEQYLRRNRDLSIEARQKILKALLIGLRDMARLRIVHRDIKPQNIIISDNLSSVKIVDFGLATYIDEPKYIFVRCGTPGFVAPEILRIKDLSKARLSMESDMFSLGAIYFQMLYGKPLFGGKDQAEVLQMNRLCKIRLPEKQDLGYGEIQLLNSMLEVDPFLRITPEQALNSIFFKERIDNSRRVFQSIQSANLPNQWTYWQEDTI